MDIEGVELGHDPFFFFREYKITIIFKLYIYLNFDCAKTEEKLEPGEKIGWENRGLIQGKSVKNAKNESKN